MLDGRNDSEMRRGRFFYKVSGEVLESIRLLTDEFWELEESAMQSDEYPEEREEVIRAFERVWEWLEECRRARHVWWSVMLPWVPAIILLFFLPELIEAMS